MSVPIRRLVNDDQWDAEDVAGRLGIVAHAAFLRSGFVPYGDVPSSGHLLKQVDKIGPSAPSLSRRYTLAQLARRCDGDAAADVAVQELRAGTNGDIAFRAFLLTRDGHRRRLCEAVLETAALAPLLSGRLDDAARAMETGAAGSWLWKSLVDFVFPVLLHELCRRNNLPLTGFASLPDDAKAEILKRLADGKDLARVECTSRQLRQLVAERDGELWKARYESLGLPPPRAQSSDSERLGSWKERYVNALSQPRRLRRYWAALLFDPFELYPWRMRDLEAELQRRRDRESELYLPWVNPVIIEPVEDPPAPPPEPVAVARGKNAGRRRRKLPRQDFQKKRHGAGAIHSPSSRYKWKHR